ncbi:MAG: hypothetical protein COV67_05390 [Nitrospinae bacterium CG11_big_fil_rev_8_21_14_0_20_56_8]|nr:MAG: hypothetical protein COV67_05390 [Nitrospinae bacterium CG11_big_fil_rev_8_21_14_0_20_56_8]
MPQTQEDTAQGQRPESERFRENGNGVITDLSLKRVWMKKDTYQLTGKWMNLVQLRDYINQVNQEGFAGYANWRLPTPAEIKSLYVKNQTNKDMEGKPVPMYHIFEPGFGFLAWTSEIRNKVQAMRFGFRKGVMTYDDIYRTSRGATRLVRDMEKAELG